MLKGFKDFISRGNVIDLAVAVVIGTAFAALVKSLVENLITPVVAALIGEPDFSGSPSRSMTRAFATAASSTP